MIYCRYSKGSDKADSPPDLAEAAKAGAAGKTAKKKPQVKRKAQQTAGELKRKVTKKAKPATCSAADKATLHTAAKKGKLSCRAPGTQLQMCQTTIKTTAQKTLYLGCDFCNAILTERELPNRASIMYVLMHHSCRQGGA